MVNNARLLLVSPSVRPMTGTQVTLIQDNVKYFLEILQNRKSDTLEWTIIVLIAAEIVLGLYEIFTKASS